MLWLLLDTSGLTKDQSTNTLSHVNFPFTHVCWVLPIGRVLPQTMASLSQLKQYCWFLNFSHVKGAHPFFMTTFLEELFQFCILRGCVRQAVLSHAWGSNSPSLLGDPVTYPSATCFSLLPSLHWQNLKYEYLPHRGIVNITLHFIFAGHFEEQWV